MSEASQDELPEDVIFDIVSNRRRRFVLRYLHEESDPADLTDIATELAAVETDAAPEEVDKQARKRAYVSLYQTHIPRLAEEKIVEYDEESGEVSLQAPAAEVLQHVDRGQSGDWWPRVYFALAVVGLGIYLPPLVGLAAEELFLAGMFVPLGVLVVSLLHWRYVGTRYHETPAFTGATLARAITRLLRMLPIRVFDDNTAHSGYLTPDTEIPPHLRAACG